MAVQVLQEIELFCGEFDFMQGQHASEFISGAIAFSQRIKIKELFVNAQILDLDFLLDAQQEQILVDVNSLALRLLFDHGGLVLMVGLMAVVNKVHITDEGTGVVAVDGHHAVQFFVGKVEIDGGQHLTELLGSHFLMVVTVPILEESLEVESCGDTEGLESSQ